MKVVVCCIDGKNLVGSHKSLWHIATNRKRMTKLPSQHYCCTTLCLQDAYCRSGNETNCSILTIICSLTTAVKLGYVYCTRKVPGWFF